MKTDFEQDGETELMGVLSPLMQGFRINSMSLRDGNDKANVFWLRENWNLEEAEKTETFDSKILECSTISRTINFTSPKEIKNFKISQKIYLMGNQIEQWHFDFGLVIPGSTNDWEQTIEAAEKQDMIPAEVLSGNMMVET